MWFEDFIETCKTHLAFFFFCLFVCLFLVHHHPPRWAWYLISEDFLSLSFFCELVLVFIAFFIIIFLLV